MVNLTQIIAVRGSYFAGCTGNDLRNICFLLVCLQWQLYKKLVVVIITAGGTVLGVFGLSFIPGLNLAQGVEAGSLFQRAVLITASNPLTIIFWAGVFPARLAEGDMEGREAYTFGFGAVLATLFFLTLIAVIGNTSGKFLSAPMIQIMYSAVGLLLIYFGVRMFARQKG